MARRWRDPRPPRGKFFPVGLGQANQGQAWASFIRQAGPLRFGARPVTSRWRRWDPAWPQANQGQAWASFIRPVLTADLRGLRLLPSGRRRWDPPWTRPLIWPPPYLRQAGPLRFGARPVTSRGRFIQPPWPQANQGQAWASWIRQEGNHPADMGKLINSRGRWIQPPFPATTAVITVTTQRDQSGKSFFKRWMLWADI